MKGGFSFLQSHVDVQNNQYYISYVVEPMLELVWTEDATSELTRYKVLFHIATNLIHQPVQLVDSKSCNSRLHLDRWPYLTMFSFPPRHSSCRTRV